MSSITLDQVINAVNAAAPNGADASAKGIAIARVIERMDAQHKAATVKRNTPKAPVKAARVTVDRQSQMASLKPSEGQRKRINRLHAAQGLREYGTRQFKQVFPTMLDASNYWNDISAA